MPDAIFLSAGVPDPKRGPQYAETADTVAIAAAVAALIHVVLGRRMLVWGGQPAITPMIWSVCEGLDVDYGSWVRLYQSRYFEDEFPDDNRRFKNVTYTDALDRDRERSLALMRERMFSDFTFTAGVFIGGMGGIVQEFDLLREMQPQATLVPVSSTGGAVRDLFPRIGRDAPDLNNDLDYVGLFHRHLGISVKELRYRVPQEQPKAIVERFWRGKPVNDREA